MRSPFRILRPDEDVPEEAPSCEEMVRLLAELRTRFGHIEPSPGMPRVLVSAQEVAEARAVFRELREGMATPSEVHLHVQMLHRVLVRKLTSPFPVVAD